jgi:ribosome biogenesis GTPase A
VIKDEDKIELSFLPDAFVALLIGKPNSGKSFLIRELILNKKLYKKHFNYVFIFSPYEIKDLECK